MQKYRYLFPLIWEIPSRYSALGSFHWWTAWNAPDHIIVGMTVTSIFLTQYNPHASLTPRDVNLNKHHFMLWGICSLIVPKWPKRMALKAKKSCPKKRQVTWQGEMEVQMFCMGSWDQDNKVMKIKTVRVQLLAISYASREDLGFWIKGGHIFLPKTFPAEFPIKWCSFGW